MNNFKNNLMEPTSIFGSCIKLLNDIKNDNSNYEEVINDINRIENIISGIEVVSNEDVLILNNYMYEKYIKNKINTSLVTETSPEKYVSITPQHFYIYDLYLL